MEDSRLTRNASLGLGQGHREVPGGRPGCGRRTRGGRGRRWCGIGTGRAWRGPRAPSSGRSAGFPADTTAPKEPEPR
eukprot:246163-Rhodomonas_salina.1